MSAGTRAGAGTGTGTGTSRALLDCVRSAALTLLAGRDPDAKATGVRELYDRLLAGAVQIRPASRLRPPPGLPGRPDRPRLVAPRELPRRSMASPAGRAALLHALTHIEFNAINLALDAVWRFHDLPEAYYRDWLQVAADEARHFQLLAARLAEFGQRYGEFDAHDGLWEMAEKTRDDVLARVALVPRTLEARGLDAVPPLRARLVQAGDLDSAALLDIILHDEIEHVAIGNQWYRWLCDARGVEPHAVYRELAIRYQAPRLRGPFNFEARRAAGFDTAELAALTESDR
jgi:uncharacterized ferritin-like protein (DUF455 family)